MDFYVKEIFISLCCVYITSINFGKLTERTSQKAVQVSTRTTYKYIISLRNFISKIKGKTIQSRVIEPFVANVAILYPLENQKFSGTFGRYNMGHWAELSCETTNIIF